eukprot:TCONS_00063224-protein
MSRTIIMADENRPPKKTKKVQKSKNPLLEMSTNTEDTSTTSETGDHTFIPVFDPSQNPWAQIGAFQQNLTSLIEDTQDIKRKMDIQLSSKGKKAKSEILFKYKNNRLNYNFLEDIRESIDEARDLSAAGSKKGWPVV